MIWWPTNRSSPEENDAVGRRPCLIKMRSLAGDWSRKHSKAQHVCRRAMPDNVQTHRITRPNDLLNDNVVVRVDVCIPSWLPPTKRRGNVFVRCHLSPFVSTVCPEKDTKMFFTIFQTIFGRFWWNLVSCFLAACWLCGIDLFSCKAASVFTINLLTYLLEWICHKIV